MAYIKSTQTCPKFQYIFTALERDNMAAGSVLVSVEAETLYEAKAKLKARYTATFYRERKPADANPVKFIWRFLSPTNPAAPQGKLLVILIPAMTEEEARSVLPGCKLAFSARLPITDGLMEVRHV